MIRTRAFAWSLVTVLLFGGCAGPPTADRPVAVGPPVEVDVGSSDPDAAERVLAVYREAVRQADDAVARGQLGMAYEINGFRNAALETYDQASRLDPGDPRWTYLKALLLAAVGEIAPALEVMDRSIEADKLYVPAHLYRGQWLLDTGDPIGAEASYREALSVDPSNRTALLGMARATIQRQEAEKAVEMLLDYLSERPNDAYAHQLLGTAYRDLGDLDKAREALARGRPDARPDRWPDPRVEEKLRFVAGYGADMLAGENFLSANQTAEAITVFESLLERRPDDAQAINNLAVAYRRDGQDERALALLLDAVESDPDYFPYYMNLTTIYHNAGDYEKALGFSEQAIRFNPTLAQAHARRGAMLMALDRNAEALEAYETAVSYEPDNRFFVVYAGMLATEIGECERAVRWLEKGMELSPSLLPGFIALGECKAKLGDFDGADAALAEAEALHPNSESLAETRRLVEELKSKGS